MSNSLSFTKEIQRVGIVLRRNKAFHGTWFFSFPTATLSRTSCRVFDAPGHQGRGSYQYSHSSPPFSPGLSPASAPVLRCQPQIFLPFHREVSGKSCLSSCPGSTPSASPETALTSLPAAPGAGHGMPGLCVWAWSPVRLAAASSGQLLFL